MDCDTANAVVGQAHGVAPGILIHTVEPTALVVVPQGQFRQLQNPGILYDPTGHAVHEFGLEL